MVGTYTTPCQKLDIADDDKIEHVSLVADEDKLRGIHVHLANGEEKFWGQFRDTNFERRKHGHDLSDKIDLLGLFAYIKQVPVGP